jgi:L-lactate dehydrogenase complex protein LldG
MTAAREEILNAVEKALPLSRLGAAAVDAEARALIGELSAVRPKLPLTSVTASFTQRVAESKVGAGGERVRSIDELPGAVARYLSARSLPPHIVLQPARMLTALDWASAGLYCDGSLDDGVVVGVARWGVAEYGSLVFHSAPDAPILFNFLPAVHIVAVHATSIVAYLEDYAAAARLSGDPAPRNACLITGASGTTDIEGDFVRGAHGPRELHIVIIDDILSADSFCRCT